MGGTRPSRRFGEIPADPEVRFAGCRDFENDVFARVAARLKPVRCVDVVSGASERATVGATANVRSAGMSVDQVVSER